MTYIPTEQELIEMGFKCRHDDGKNWWSKNQVCYEESRGFFIEHHKIYPRSREHLEQIILAFTK